MNIKDKIKYCHIPTTENNSFIFDHVRIYWHEQVDFHQHPTWELSYVIKGKGMRVIGDTIEPFTEGEVILIPPHIPHCWSFDEFGTPKGKIENITISFTGNLLERSAEAFPELSRGLSKIRQYTEAVSFTGTSLKRLQKTLHCMQGETAIERLASFFKLMAIIDSSGEMTIVGKSVIEDKRADRLQQVYMYVLNNYQQNITLDEVAKLVSLDKSSFCVFFKKKTGKSFVTFLTEYRIEASCQMLTNTTLSIAEISFAAGFKDIPYYNRVFKKHKKVTPTEYRNTMRS